jgi:ketol-acid reductoisomerase
MGASENEKEKMKTPKVLSPSDILHQLITEASQKVYDKLRKYWLGILDEKACFEIAAESMHIFLLTRKFGSFVVCRQFAKHGLRCNFDMSRKIFSEFFFEPMKQMLYDARIGQFHLIDDYDHITIEFVERTIR